MNTREKATFLRANGWRMHQGTHWWDPSPTAYWPIPFDHAFLIASRRKAQRERAALRKAGLVFGEAEPPRCGIGWWRPEGMYWYGDRAQAIKLLGIT